MDHRPSVRIRCKSHADMENSTLELYPQNSQKAECLPPLYLRVIPVAGISDSTGLEIPTHILKGHRHTDRISSYT